MRFNSQVHSNYFQTHQNSFLDAVFQLLSNLFPFALNFVAHFYFRYCKDFYVWWFKFNNNITTEALTSSPVYHIFFSFYGDEVTEAC